MKKSQNGFSVVELIIILMVILALLGAGWFVFTNKDKQQNETPSKPQTNSEAQDKPAEKPQNTKKYLEIKELDIKVELNAATDDAYYVMNNGYAYISLTSLKNADPECGADKTGVVAIGKYDKNDIDEQSGKTYGDLAASGGKVIGNDAYYMNRSQAYCSDDLTIQTKQQAAWNAFLAQATTIQAL